MRVHFRLQAANNKTFRTPIVEQRVVLEVPDRVTKKFVLEMFDIEEIVRLLKEATSGSATTRSN